MSKSSLVSIIIFFVIVALVFVFVLPAWNDVSSLMAVKEEGQKELENRESIVANIDELLAQYEKAKSDLDKISLAIPNSAQLPELLIQLEEIVKKNGMVMGDIKFSQEQESSKSKVALNDIKTIKINIEAEGSYLNFKGLLRDLETNIRLMNVNNISFSRSGDDQDSIKFIIGMTSYYLADEQQMDNNR